ncbi:MAG: hypothetical protein ACJ72H_28605 [Candidatus Sulfotelmatobacter sp.]
MNELLIQIAQLREQLQRCADSGQWDNAEHTCLHLARLYAQLKVGKQ